MDDEWVAGDDDAEEIPIRYVQSGGLLVDFETGRFFTRRGWVYSPDDRQLCAPCMLTELRSTGVTRLEVPANFSVKVDGVERVCDVCREVIR